MTSLGALGAAFFRGGLVRKVVTAYSGNSFPTYTPNPIFRKAYESGEVEVEHWSILTLSQRLEAAARGLPAAVTGSLVGSSMAENEAFSVVESPFGPLGVLEPLAPDVALVHAAAADPAGNLAFSEPLLDGVWGAWAARRGVVATVERVVDDLEGLGHRVRVPGHLVLAVVEAPYGAHPGGCYAPGLPVRSYGEDIAHWSAAAAAAAHGEFDDYVDEWVLGPATHEDYLTRVGTDHLLWLEGRSDPMSWKADADANPVAEDHAFTQWEQAASFGRARGRAGRRRGRRRRRAGRGGRGEPGGLGRRGAGEGGRQPGGAHGRARPVGLRADAGGPLHLQPTGLPLDALALRRVQRPRHGDRRPGHQDGGMPRCGGGRQRRVPELDRAGRGTLPRRLGRSQRRGQPGDRLCRRHAGPAGAAAARPRPM